MKISKKTMCIIISLVMLLPLIFATASFYPGTVLRVKNPGDNRFGSRIDRATDGSEIVITGIVTLALLTIVWIGVYEKDTLNKDKRKKS